MKLMRRLFVAGLLCVFQIACLSVSLVYGQGGMGGRGTINGTVADPTGALVGDAEVSIKNTLTGQVTTVNTTSNGNYSAPFLQAGKYEISASHEGFETQTQTNLTLTADEVASVNFTLKVGAATTHVEVEAAATQIDTTTGAVAQVIDQRSITELPLNGRNPAALIGVAAGAIAGGLGGAIAIPGPGSGSPLETAASVNGSRNGGVIYQLDGVINMNNYFQSASPFPNSDASQEFRVITNNFDAQYGYTAGAIVSIATRSGTNQWHGVGFEFLRNSVLNSKDYFTHNAAPLKRNQFGGSIGGPIIKDKLFVFGNVQFTRERISGSSSGARVPDNAELGGNFSEMCGTGFTNGICNDRSSTGAVVDQLYKSWNDHTPANAYLNNQVDPSTFSQFALNLEKGLPKTDVTGGLFNIFGITQANNIYEYTTRADYNISSTQTLSGRFFYDNYNRPAYGGGGDYLAGSGGSRSALDQVMNVEISHVWTIRPNLVNDLRGGYNRNNSQALSALKAVGGGPLSFLALGSNLNEIGNDPLGYVSISGTFGLSGIPVNQGRHNWTVNDTVSLTTGKQTVMAGFTAFTQYGLEQATWEGDPLVFFSGAVTGNANADFLLGRLDNAQASGGEYNEYSAKSYSAFVQDSIKIEPNLSINLGVRWEPQIAPVPILGHLADFYPGQQSTRFPNAPPGLVFPGDAGVSAGGWNNQWDTFLPRASVAWSPKALPNTTIRGAFGLMALPYDYSFYNHQSANAPFSPSYTIAYNQVGSCILNIADPFACYAPTGFKDPFPPFAGPSFNPTQNVAFATPASLTAVFTKGYQSAKEETWNLSIQHSVGSHLLFGVTYIGRHDYHLPLPLQLSPGVFNDPAVGPNGTYLLSPNFNSVLAYTSIGVASYNAVQVSAEKRFSHGLQFSSNFTYSKNLDESSMASESNVGSVYDPYNPRLAYGISNLSVPRLWNNTLVYQTPKLAGMNKAASTLLGNWEISAIWQLHSGLPFSVYGGTNPSTSACGGRNASCANVNRDLADLVSGQSLQVHRGSKSQWIQQYFNPKAVTFNAIGTFGSSPRNLMFGPGWNNADMMFSKNFPFRERYNVQFRWEMFNAFNRTEFGLPSNNYNPSPTSGFGRITGTAGSPRVMQAGLKLNF